MAEATEATEAIRPPTTAGGHDDPIGPTATVIGLIALTALGALARFHRLGDQALWMDEVFALNAARLVGREGLLAVARLDHSAPASYWLAWLSIRLGGESASWLRLPMAVAGTLTVPMTYALGMRLFRSAPLGMAAAAVTAASPFAVWYAQDARMYALLILMAAVYVHVCWPAASGRPGPAGWAAMVATTAVGLYVHQYLALLSAIFGLFLLASLGPRDRRVWIWAGTQVVGALAFVPWIVLSAEHLGNSAGSEKPMPLLWMPYTYYAFVAGFSLGPTDREIRLDGPASALRAHAGSIVLVGLATAAAGIAGIRRLLRAGDRRAGSWCLLWAVGPMALAILMARVTSISYNARYAAACFPAVVLVLAGAVVSARRSPLAAAGVAGLAVAMGWSLWNWYESPRYAKEDLRDAAAFLADAFDEGDLMVFANARAVPTLAIYGFPFPGGALAVSDPGAVAEVAEAIGRLGDGPGRRVWLLEYREWEVDPGRVLRSALDASAGPADERRWPGVTLRLYRSPGRDPG